MADIFLLLGTTASGKSAAAMALAPRLNAEIVSVDSMQVYRHMDIGTAKPTAAELAAVPHHLIDVVDPSESMSVARFVQLADTAIADILARGRRVLIVGGTPLYLMGMMYGLFDGPSADPVLRQELRERADREGIGSLHAELRTIDAEAADRIHVNDYKRIERAIEVYRLTGRPLSAQQVQWSAQQLRYPAAIIGIDRQKEDASRRINARVREMVSQGLVREVSELSARFQLSEQARQALGYAEILRHLSGELSLDDAIEEIKIHTRQFAKHQRTWYRKFPQTHWMPVGPGDIGQAVVDDMAAYAESHNTIG